MLFRLTLLLALFHANAAMAIEEPDYTVLQTNDIYEIREYAPYIVAEVDVDGNARQAGNSAFRILAGYIFGDNTVQEKMAMTAPVESRRASSEKMAMTAPVLTTEQSDGYTYAFVMEARYTLDTLPKPNDPRIRIREKPSRIVAVRRFSGSWSESRSREQEQVLRAALDEDEIKIVGELEVARYDSPFTLPFMRRNEVMFAVQT